MKKILVLILALSFAFASVPAFAGTENDAAIIGDFLFARPLGLVAVVAGAGLFVLTLPFAAASHSVDKTSNALLRNPAKYTFERPFGDFDYSLDAGDENGNN